MTDFVKQVWADKGTPLTNEFIMGAIEKRRQQLQGELEILDELAHRFD